MSYRSLAYGRRCSCKESGLTLVELMVAIVIGLILTAGVIQIFIGSQQTYRFQESLSRIQENGRFAMETMGRDLRGADYQGCGGRSSEFYSLLGSAASEEFGFGGDGLRGFTYDGAWTPALPERVLAENPDPNSDVIQISAPVGGGVDVIETRWQSANTDIALGFADQFNIGDVVWATDCNATNEFQITNILDDVGSSEGPVMRLNHSRGGNISPGNQENPTSMPPLADNAQVISLRSWIYFVAPSTVPGSQELALFRMDRDGDSQELVEGVERMHLMFGEDTNGDRQVNRYVTADEVGSDDWENIVSVRISFLIRGGEDNITEEPQIVAFPPGANPTTFDDRRLRQVFTTTIGIRNRLQ